MALVLTIKEAASMEIQNLASNKNTVDSFLQSQRKKLDLDKAWHGIHYLLSGQAFEAEGPAGYLMMGGISLGEIHRDYGPARALNPQEIQALYGVMSQLSEEELKTRYRPEAMEEIYPGWWDPELDSEDFLYLLHYYSRLKVFLEDLVLQHKGAVVFIK